MNDHDYERENLEYLDGRNLAMNFAKWVYVGGVLVASSMFLNFVLSEFSSDQYFMRFIMGLGGVLVGSSALAFPVAIQKWAMNGKFRSKVKNLYHGELLILAINTIVSFAVLLGKNGWTIPEWIILIEPFSIGAVIYTIWAWGTVFNSDPLAVRKAKRLEAFQEIDEEILSTFRGFLKTNQGKQAIVNEASVMIGDRFNEMRHTTPDWEGAIPVDSRSFQSDASLQAPTVNPTERGASS